MNDGALGLSIADVVGKGVPAALMMASVRSALRSYASQDYSPVFVIGETNRHMCRDTLHGEFATVFYGVFLPGQRRMIYVNAGHDPPLLLRRGTFRELTAGGLVVGIHNDGVYEQGAVDLRGGDTVVFYTDGVVETLDFEGRSFGRNRLRESIRKHHLLAANTLANQIKWDTRRFAGLAQQGDDISIVVAKVR